ncbi:unnamed protein product [Brassica rapa]|uniref:Uncharacterized protein n=1 Tax=Brassica campestris TaxID=3711 RepID=A0A3P6A477_BRACM|nr:unnamed protein product [Brassica rapa]VDC79780.1 unnamed protein product [Brassica rapa]
MRRWSSIYGPLFKRSETLRKWNERWCLLIFFFIIFLCTVLDISTPQKKDYFLCAETHGAARAWVTTLHATQLVLKAHKEAVDSLSGSGSSTLWYCCNRCCSC